MEHIIVYDTDGMMYSLWNDDLLALYEVESSHVEVERASHVEFNPQTQRWYVYNPDGVTLMLTACGLMWTNLDGFLHRSDALAWEKEEIERRLMEGKG